MTDIFDGSQVSHKSQTQPGSDPADASAVATEVTPVDRRRRRTKHVDEYSTVMRDTTPSRNPFHSYAAKPENVFFDSQLDGEQILLLLRRHPVTQLGWIAIALGLLLLPFLFSYVDVLGFLPVQFHWAALLGWYLLVTGFALESFLTWFFNVYIVTDERIIDVDFYSLLYKHISSAKIDNIEDITATTGGALGSLFNYGTIKIQTAAAIAEFEFDDVPNPDKITAFLSELLQEEEQEKIEGRVR